MEAIITIKKVYNIPGIGIVLVGDVKSGVLKDKMISNIDGKTVTIMTIEKNRKKVDEANVGDNVGLSLSGGEYNKLKKMKGLDITFIEGNPDVGKNPQKSNPNHPSGFLGKLFRR